MLKRMKSFIAVVCALSLLFSFSAAAETEDAAGSAYLYKYDPRSQETNCLPAVEQQQGSDCIYYALLSTAGSYCMKYLQATAKTADFDEARLSKELDNSSNFGSVLSGAVPFDLGGGYYITGFESLTGRGERLLKKRILEHGAVLAAFSLPAGVTMETEEYCFQGADESVSFLCKRSDVLDPKNSHAVSIVGWDDSFALDPSVPDDFHWINNGAWLCKNSYGTAYGNGGYFWLPYDYPLLYAAAVEVSKGGVTAVQAANQSLFACRLTGVGFFWPQETPQAEIKVSVRGRQLFSGEASLRNGYTYLPMDAFVSFGKPEITVNGKPCTNALVYRSSILRASGLPAPQTARVANWDMPIPEDETLMIDVRGGVPFASHWSEYREEFHTIYLSAIDGRYHVRPADGWYFTDDTEIDLYDGDTSYDLATIKEFDPRVLKFKDGELILNCLTAASGFATGLEIKTDEHGVISDLQLLANAKDGEQTKAPLPLDQVEFKYYSCADGARPTLGDLPEENRLDAPPKQGSYYAVLEIADRAYEDGFAVWLDDAVADAEIQVVYDEMNKPCSLTVGVVIEIPDVTIRGGDILNIFLDSFAGFIKLIFGLS